MQSPSYIAVLFLILCSLYGPYSTLYGDCSFSALADPREAPGMRPSPSPTATVHFLSFSCSFWGTSTSKYINYSKYGTDSNTEDEAKPKNKKPRVGKWPSVTRE